MKKRKIIAKLMVLSMIISNASNINVQATYNNTSLTDNIIEYNVNKENSETFEDINIDEEVIDNEIIENDNLISAEDEVVNAIEESDQPSLEEVYYEEGEEFSEEVNISSPMVSRAAAISNVNILSSDSTTVAQAEAWARAKGATEEFIGLASLYQKYASSRGGVNWVVAYVQAAKETGYGRFGGVLDASYHNPCGLKNSSGGADEDPNAHKRFDNWDQGVMAHLDHLALYAGASGYPKTNYVSKWQGSNLDNVSTYDPRHFAYLIGRATTVIDLGGQWAPSSTYGVEIFRLYCDLSGATYLPAKSNLEDPTENLNISDGKLRVKGWALHAFGIKQINVYLDGALLGNAQYGLERSDVNRFFQDYYKSNNSGFDTTFDISNIANGSKSIEVVIVANDGSKTTITRNITVNRLVSRSNLDDPYGTDDIISNTLQIRGWALSGSGVKSVEAFIDETSYGQIKYGVSRVDVNKAYPGYTSGDNCGFDGIIDISKSSNGTKTLKVVITSNDGSTQTLTKSIKINRVTLKSRSNLDDPYGTADITSNTLQIRGWALSGSEVKSVEAFIDETSYGQIKYGVSRADVNKAYPGYPSGNNCGFDGIIDISKSSNGTKTLKVVITSNDGSTQILTKSIKINRVTLKSRSNLDDPYGTADITSNTLQIRGWALSGSGVKSVEAFIDGTSYGQIKYGVSRADVNKAYPGYSSGDNCGFDGTIDISKSSNGTKILKVVITSNDGSTQILTKSIKINRVILKSRSNLDDPYGTADIISNTLQIRGWALSGSGVKSVEAFIDGTSYGQIKYGVSRADVNKAYPGYSSGDNCGFDGTIDISKLSDGTKTLKVVITSNDGSTQTLSKNIVIKDLVYNLEDPNDSYLYAPNGKLLIKGWALSKTGIKEVKVTIDGKDYGTVNYGTSRPDVSRFYPNYVNSVNSGFEKTFDLSDLSDGDKNINIIIISNNGSKSTITKIVKKKTLNSVCWLDDPVMDKEITDGKLVINGWALNISGTKEIRIKVDGKLVGKATLNITRTDVYNAYPAYEDKQSGYIGTFDISSLSLGNKKLSVEIEYNDGTVQVITRNFKHGKQKTVYIDAGHDYGGDKGAIRVINGVTYDETTLNIEVAEYLRTELINKGYNVIMARRMGERPTSSNYRENLWNRINAANNANADFYISIHQNASTITSANGVEAYYSSVKPDSLNDITYKLNTSKAVATSISSGIASALSMTNRGAKDDEFMVVKYTNMPAVLVECGFISNENDAKKISNSTNQKKIASVIADSIHNSLK